MAVPNEIDVLRREVARLLHEKINAYIEPVHLDKYTLGTELTTIEDMYTTISCLRRHVLEVDARTNEKLEENAQQLAADYQLFNELVSQAKNTISTLTAQKEEVDVREATLCTLESTLLSRLLSTEAYLTARVKVAEALESAYKEQFTEVAKLYATLLESFRAVEKKLERLSHENALLRCDNRGLINEVSMLQTDRDTAQEKVENTMTMYGELGERLSVLLDQWSNCRIEDDLSAPSIAAKLQSINDNVEELRREVTIVISDLQRTIIDQETIIATLTKELDELQNKELEAKIDIAKLSFLETENSRLMRELASARCSSMGSESSHMCLNVTNASVQTMEQSGSQNINNSCGAIDAVS
ncbi:Hypothetical protein GLP15_3873 [Giardia lamblia P15]|uniref:Uncharacterized protein n=1 Tax=Giardia intestinalis (strain P15) TaxID=658858 RepID=E1F1A1_GIAIA|nr:Hypothetical protein GLP15_3873 [Giardia lamblia P15]